MQLCLVELKSTIVGDVEIYPDLTLKCHKTTSKLQNPVLGKAYFLVLWF